MGVMGVVVVMRGLRLRMGRICRLTLVTSSTLPLSLVSMGRVVRRLVCLVMILRRGRWLGLRLRMRIRRWRLLIRLTWVSGRRRLRVVMVVPVIRILNF